MSTRGMAKSERARRGFLVRNRTAAEQNDLYIKVRTMFLLTTGYQSFAKVALVRYDISCCCALNCVPCNTLL